MHNLFNPENPGMRFLSRLFDLIVLNLVFMITCIPIITIGAALGSLYRVTIQMVRQEDSYIIKGYFKAFRQNFKQATLLWIPLMIALFIFGGNLYIVLFLLDPAYKLFQVPIWIILFLLISIIIYAFPLISNYECKTKQLLKNSILISLANVPSTIFFVVFPLGLLYFAAKSAAILVFVFSITLFCGLALLAFINSVFLNRIFEKIMENDESAAKPDSESESDEISPADDILEETKTPEENIADKSDDSSNSDTDK